MRGMLIMLLKGRTEQQYPEARRATRLRNYMCAVQTRASANLPVHDIGTNHVAN